MKFRQVHLDFHTSEEIKNIGAAFDKEEFKAALRAGHVDSITLFSKCHHGWSYHPTEKGEMHPNLSFDLLSAQLEAAKEAGVHTQVYISAGLDEKMARKHPEWVIRKKNEETTWAPNFSVPGYHRLCFNSPYLDYLLGQIEEAAGRFECDGIFLDIAGVVPCYCQNCVRTMRGRGLDPYDDKNAAALAKEVYLNYTAKVRGAVDKYKKNLPVFHNGGHVIRGQRDVFLTNSHFELESLPTGDYGYEHFPLSAAYVRRFNKEYLGMTGKFHTAWGENGGFKHPNALRYEVALNCVYGAASSIGDQLHPSGAADPVTYEIIGAAYSELEKKEKYIKNLKFITDIALLSSEAVMSYYNETQFSGDMDIMSNAADEGALRILHEGKYLFDVIDTETDFTGYKLIILPDDILLDKLLLKKLEAYIKSGGKVLATGKSGLSKDGGTYPKEFGAEYLGCADMCPDYIRPKFPLKSMNSSSFVMYSGGVRVKNRNGKCIAFRQNPYFKRTVLHFSSHKHAPADPDSAEDGIIITDSTALIPWNIFTDYRLSGGLAAKEITEHVIDLLLGESKSVETNLPSGGIVSLAKQGNRTVCQLLYALPVKRGNGIEIIEDITPLYNVEIKIKSDKRPLSIYSVQSDCELKYEYANGKIMLTLPKLNNHEIIVIS